MITITHVACWSRNKLWSLPAPNRHHDVLRLVYETTGCRIDRNWQGFLTSNGKYVGREEALKIAAKAGQVGVIRGKTSPKWLLFSEDIW